MAEPEFEEALSSSGLSFRNGQAEEEQEEDDPEIDLEVRESMPGSFIRRVF